MGIKNLVVDLDHPDVALRARVLAMQKMWLATAVILAVPGILAWSMPAIRAWLPDAATMPFGAALVALACAASAAAALPPLRNRLGAIRYWIAGAAAVAAIAGLIGSSGSGRMLPALFSLVDRSSPGGAMTVQVAAAFLLLGFLLLGIDATRKASSYAADGLVLLLFLLVLFLASRYLFQATHLFPAPVLDPTRPATLAALTLLSLEAILLRSQRGAFRILMGSGVSSRIARNLMILPIAMPFLREITRARLFRTHLVPEQGAAAFLASLSAVVMVAVLVLVARYIHRMEKSIRHLSLRDELTGLYNLRGFNLLADQALRLAQRSSQPFSLLFIDVDDLKQINDTFGHGVGSSMLAETAELLKASFRESDVVARIGGDEFAVAGQLTHAAIEEAAERLEAQTALTRRHNSETVPISLSIGYVTASPGVAETLDQLLEKADAIMYNQKRRKKLQLC